MTNLSVSDSRGQTAEKRGTVVPRSDFQSVTTKCNDYQRIAALSFADTPAHACAGLRTGENNGVNVLIACEESQAECIAFRERGFNAFSCDIQPCRKKGFPQWHIEADVTPYLQGCTSFNTADGAEHNLSKWHLIIAHPPCTYLSKVGSTWLYVNPDTYVSRNIFSGGPAAGRLLFVNGDRFNKLKAAREFFFRCLNAKADFVAVENPQPMRLAGLPKPSTYACPSWFGVKYTKKTLYWLRNLPPLMAEIDYPLPKSFVRSSRGKYRSRTFPQLAQAIAHQWGDYILDNLKTPLRPQERQ